ncbi:hypothetical protein JL722_5606 [Aureococcus anophagefferens]|nr:hypothetical protein JL722_5606 [Aureococcus anophagefferens]
MFALIIFGVCQAARHDERVVAEACASRVPGWAAYGDDIMASEAPTQGKRGVAYVARLPQTHNLNASVPRVVFAVVRRGDARRIRQTLRDGAVAASAAARGCAPRIYYAGGLGDNSSRVMTIAEMAGDRVGADFLRETDARLARRFGRLLACVHALDDPGVVDPALAAPATLRGWLGAASVGAVDDRGALVGAYAAQIAKYWWPPVRDSRAAEDKFSRIYDFAFERAAAWTTSRLAAAPVTVHDDVHAPPVDDVPSWARKPEAPAKPETFTITFQNGSLFQSVLYIADWRASWNFFRGGQTVERPDTGTPLRVALGASLGAYARDDSRVYLVALELEVPGAYEITLSGTSLHVVLSGVSGPGCVTRHLFEEESAFDVYMRGGPPPPCTYSARVYRRPRGSPRRRTRRSSRRVAETGRRLSTV